MTARNSAIIPLPIFLCLVAFGVLCLELLVFLILSSRQLSHPFQISQQVLNLSTVYAADSTTTNTGSSTSTGSIAPLTLVVKPNPNSYVMNTATVVSSGGNSSTGSQ
ncbi:MAG TPA: hypothetical protein VG935_04995 [Patescibacteria group bacterium]|nr:hypothetical protein [Patescibacteria group bacterium]